ncbi:MAG: 23S rRNA (adenine(2030)-N(6))-methyltransferase RlmJ [Asticcacaulis sp.]
MNYRHGFHAGNFADLFKHAVLLNFLRALRENKAPLQVVDTHAGAGQYDLSNPTFARSKEAEAGVGYLLSGEVPDSLKPLSDYVWAKNRAAGFTQRIGLYPGSPLLVLDHMTAGGRYVGCELREDDYEWLKDTVLPRGGKARRTDGYEAAVEAAEADSDLLLLIDPPFERFEDYERINETLREVLTRRPEAKALVWLPLKDLETFDRFLRHMECELLEDQTGQGGPEVVVAELRLRPLTNPLKMNGCALVLVNAPASVSEAVQAIGEDLAAVFAEAGGKSVVWALD